MALNFMNAASPANRRYRCRNGVIQIACQNEQHWRALARSLGRPELAYPGSWPVVSVSAPRGRIGRLLEKHLREDNTEEWLARLLPAGVPAAAEGHPSAERPRT